MDQEINQLSMELMNVKQSRDMDHEVEDTINRIQSSIQTDLDRIREDDAFRDFLLEYIDEQYHAYKDNEMGRETPLCTCPSPSCELKDGKIPSTLDLAKSLSRGFSEFRQDHRGKPVILDEARQQWRETKRHVKDQLRTCIAMARQNRVPERIEREWADDEGKKEIPA